MLALSLCVPAQPSLPHALSLRFVLSGFTLQACARASRKAFRCNPSRGVGCILLLLFHLLLFHLSIIVAPIYYCFTRFAGWVVYVKFVSIIVSPALRAGFRVHIVGSFLLLFHPLRGLGLIPVVFVFTPSLLKGEAKRKNESDDEK
jgi:hypothetical protein